MPDDVIVPDPPATPDMNAPVETTVATSVVSSVCPVCGGSRDGLKPVDPCPVDGKQLEDSP